MFFFCADCRISEKIIKVQYLIRACRLEKILKINKRACMAFRQLRADYHFFIFFNKERLITSSKYELIAHCAVPHVQSSLATGCRHWPLLLFARSPQHAQSQSDARRERKHILILLILHWQKLCQVSDPAVLVPTIINIILIKNRHHT